MIKFLILKIKELIKELKKYKILNNKIVITNKWYNLTYIRINIFFYSIGFKRNKSFIFFAYQFYIF